MHPPFYLQHTNNKSNMTQKSNYVKFTTALFFIYIISLLCCGAFFYYRIKVMDNTFDLISNSVRVKQKIKQVEADVSKSESAQRGFLLTNDSIFLEHWQKANSHALKAIDTISALTAENPLQAKYADQLREVTIERLRLLKKTLEMKEQFNTDPDLKKGYLLSGKKTMDALLSISGTMDSVENQILTDRRQSRDEARALTPKYVFGILLFSIFIISICYFALLRFYR